MRLRFKLDPAGALIGQHSFSSSIISAVSVLVCHGVMRLTSSRKMTPLGRP
jgi:hypothetical protein